MESTRTLLRGFYTTHEKANGCRIDTWNRALVEVESTKMQGALSSKAVNYLLKLA